MKSGDSFLCACGRQQTYQPAKNRGGITWEEARWIGWTGTPAKPTCPICNEERRKTKMKRYVWPKSKPFRYDAPYEEIRENKGSRSLKVSKAHLAKIDRFEQACVQIIATAIDRFGVSSVLDSLAQLAARASAARVDHDDGLEAQYVESGIHAMHNAIESNVDLFRCSRDRGHLFEIVERNFDVLDASDRDRLVVFAPDVFETQTKSKKRSSKTPKKERKRGTRR